MRRGSTAPLARSLRATGLDADHTLDDASVRRQGDSPRGLTLAMVALSALSAAACRRRELAVDARSADVRAPTDSHTESTRDAQPSFCATPGERFVYRFLQHMVSPEVAAIPTDLFIAQGGPIEVVPPDSVPTDGGVYSWTSQRFPGRPVPAGHAVWPRWPIIAMPADRSIETVGATIQGEREALLGCYRREGASITQEHNDGGWHRSRWRLVASLDIEPTGAVSNVRVRRAVGDAHPLETCVADVLRRLTFAPSCLTAEVHFSIEARTPP